MTHDVFYKLLAICGIAAAIGFIPVDFGQPDSTAAPQAHASFMAKATSAGQASAAIDTVGGDVRSEGSRRAGGYLWSELPPETVGVSSWVEQQ